MMRRIYHLLALMALIHLFALGGLVGYLFVSGRLNQERVEQIAVVLRGQFPTSQPATQPAVEPPPPPPEPSRTEIERIQAQKDYYALLAERHQRELDDRRTLNERIQLDVVQKLEEIEKQKTQMEQQRKAIAEQGQQEGFTRTLEMVSNMDPVLAKNLLKNQTKEADAVAILKAMDMNRVKKILNACKAQDEMLWVGRILNQIQGIPGEDGQPGGGVDGPKPSSGGG